MRRVVLFHSAFRAARIVFPVCIFLSALYITSACSSYPRSSGKWISLSPSSTEILFGIGAGPEVCGVCSPADYPEAASGIPEVASWQKVDIEAIVAASPEGCFTVDGMQAPETIQTLSRLGIKVHSYPMKSMNDLFECIDTRGKLTGHSGESDSLISAMMSKIESARSGIPVQKQNAIIIVGLNPLVVAGGNSFMDDMLHEAGYRNPLGELGSNWPQVSLERVASSLPDLVVYPEGEFGETEVKATINQLNSLMKKKVSSLAIDADILSRPGPRSPQALVKLCAERKRGIHIEQN